MCSNQNKSTLCKNLSKLRNNLQIIMNLSEDKLRISLVKVNEAVKSSELSKFLKKNVSLKIARFLVRIYIRNLKFTGLFFRES